MTCEIMNTILDEALNSYKREIIIELQSRNTTDMQNNVDCIENWIEKNFKQ